MAIPKNSVLKILETLHVARNHTDNNPGHHLARRLQRVRRWAVLWNGLLRRRRLGPRHCHPSDLSLARQNLSIASSDGRRHSQAKTFGATGDFLVDLSNLSLEH
jgi:hypothetical protein